MKRFRIIYHIMADAHIVIVIFAKSYDDACAFAKDYRKESFSVQELQ